MNRELLEALEQMKAEGLEPEREQRLRQEVEFVGTHERSLEEERRDGLLYPPAFPTVYAYAYQDLSFLQGMTAALKSPTVNIRSIDELLERDKQREKDGFPRKIRVGKLIKPGRGGEDKIVVVPTTQEEKLIHDPTFPCDDDGGGQGGSGAGEEGEVIGEQPVRPSEEAGEGGAGQGGGDSHEIESGAYDLGRILTEKFELPNLKEKGKKASLTRYTYDLTDKNRGFGQLLDKKATLRRVIQTNISLGRVPDVSKVDTSRFLIAPRDKVYRILSREKDYESQAMIFFVRDYSGSMMGKATELVVSQHVMIYAWLLYQYARQVETRFILHDSDAREVEDFYTYYNLRVAGGTKVAAAYRLVNEIIEQESLARDYNIYVFHGTDGDDWDTQGSEAIPELGRMLKYTNRIGITIAEHVYGSSGNTEVQRYLRNSGLLESHPDLLRLDVMGEDADENRIIEGIRNLIS